MKIGIAGGIGSGKSYVAARLAARGITVYDCDTAAKRLMRTSPELRQQLTELIGSLDKAAISRFLLASEDNQRAINAIVHPAVFADFVDSGLDWLESAIMYESGADRYVDRVVVVTAPEEVRIKRIMRRDNITREQALQWIARQWPQDKVRQLADYEIVNDGQQDIDKQIDDIIHSLARNIETSKYRNIENKTKRKMQQTILAIAGKPGLYKLISRGKNNLIVEALDATHRRQPAFGTDRITSLADIAMFTETDDVPLMTILESVKKLEGGKKASIDPKKASADELHEYFTKVLPEWDRDRVKNSHIQKLIQWYNILIEAGITDFEEEMKPTEGDNIDDRKEQE